MYIEDILLGITEAYGKKNGIVKLVKCELGEDGAFGVTINGGHAALNSLATHMRVQRIDGVRVEPTTGVRTDLRVSLPNNERSEEKLINCYTTIIAEKLAPQAEALFKRAQELVSRGAPTRKSVVNGAMLRALNDQLNPE